MENTHKIKHGQKRIGYQVSYSQKDSDGTLRAYVRIMLGHWEDLAHNAYESKRQNTFPDYHAKRLAYGVENGIQFSFNTSHGQKEFCLRMQSGGIENYPENLFYSISVDSAEFQSDTVKLLHTLIGEMDSREQNSLETRSTLHALVSMLETKHQAILVRYDKELSDYVVNNGVGSVLPKIIPVEKPETE